MKTDLDKLYEKGIEMHHITNTAYPLTPGSFHNYKIKNENEIRNLLINDLKKVDELSLYVHIPFCKSRCKFCEYAVVSGEDNEKENKYVEYLLKEIDMYKKIIGDRKIVGFDMGGGTPTKLSSENIKKITEYLKSSFNFGNFEMSIETTPLIAMNEPEKIKELYETGYRRISMGIQTINPSLLESFGRDGSLNIYEKAIQSIRKAGFEKFNIDLMYGFLNQSLEDFEATIKYAISVNPEYITLYRNRYKGTKIVDEAEHVTLAKVNEQYHRSFDLLTSNGYEGNYCKNTFSRIKNDYGTSDYLTGRVVKGTPYIGFGLGAQSFGNGYLAYNEGAASKTLKTYFEKIDNNLFPIQDIYDLPVEESIAKMVSVAFYFGFVDFNEFKNRFGIDFEEHFKNEIEFLINKRLVHIEDNRMFVTKEGTEKIGGVIPMFYSEPSREELIKIKKIF